MTCRSKSKLWTHIRQATVSFGVHRDHTLQILIRGIARFIDDFVECWRTVIIVLKLSWLFARHGGVGTERRYSSTDCNPDITWR